MKKNIIPFIAVGVILLGCLIWYFVGLNKINNNGDEKKVAYPDNSYRKVTYQVDLSVQPNQLEYQDSNGGALMCLPEGKVSVELYFPADGGEAVKQNNTVLLTNYKCYNHGTSQACEVVSLDSNAYTPLNFTFSKAVLDKDFEKDAEISLDRIRLKKEKIMNVRTVTVNANCTDSGPTTIPDQFNFAALPDFFAHGSAGEEKYYSFETILETESSGSDFDTVYSSMSVLHYYVSNVKYAEKTVTGLEE